MCRFPRMRHSNFAHQEISPFWRNHCITSLCDISREILVSSLALGRFISIVTLMPELEWTILFFFLRMQQMTVRCLNCMLSAKIKVDFYANFQNIFTTTGWAVQQQQTETERQEYTHTHAYRRKVQILRFFSYSVSLSHVVFVLKTPTHRSEAMKKNVRSLRNV